VRNILISDSVNVIQNLNALVSLIYTNNSKIAESAPIANLQKLSSIDAQIAVRKQCFVPSVWGLGYITLEGFAIRNAANPFSDWNTIMNERTIGLDIGLGCDEWAGNKGILTKTNYTKTELYGSHMVPKNKFLHNGQGEIAGVFSWNSDIIENVFMGTNSRGGYMGIPRRPLLKCITTTKA
jgi:hypothetical protein